MFVSKNYGMKIFINEHKKPSLQTRLNRPLIAGNVFAQRLIVDANHRIQTRKGLN